MPFNFTQRLLEITRIVESPTSYLEWASYMAVATVLRHNVYYDFPSRRTRVTPNMYVILVGDSGATRKSNPLKIVNSLIKRVGNTKLIEGRASIQGVLKELAKSTQQGAKTLTGAGGLLYSEEFAAFLVKDPQVTSVLTDIYDYKDEHQVILKSEDILTLKNVCVNLFAATNAAFLQDMFSRQDLFGGLVGRTIFVIEEKARHKSLGLDDPSDEKEWDELHEHLFKLSRMHGKVHLEADAKDYLEKWYATTDFTIYESKTGYEHRAHTHALKLALVFAACDEGFDLSVKLDHIQRAVTQVSLLKRNYHKLVTTAGLSTSSTLQAIKDVTRILLNNFERELDRDELLRLLFGQVDLETLDRAMNTLIATGFVSQGGTNRPTYQLSEKGRKSILGELGIRG